MADHKQEGIISTIKSYLSIIITDPAFVPFNVDDIVMRETKNDIYTLDMNGFRILPRPDPNTSERDRFTAALQTLLNAYVGGLSDDWRYILQISHPEIPIHSGKMIYVNFRKHSESVAGQIAANVHSLIQSSKPLAFTDKFDIQVIIVKSNRVYRRNNQSR